MDDTQYDYNFHFTSPLSLEELASLEVALNVWRRVIRQHTDENGDIKPRYFREKTSLRCMIPEVPPTILSTIKECVNKLEVEIPKWVEYHSELNRIVDSEFDVLNHFMDFVFDYDGKINYEKTAKRFMLCDGISNDAKFKMACFYCLENDILRIWPEVSSRMTAYDFDFQLQPEIYYWIARLKNQPHRVSILRNTSKIEEHTLRVIYKTEQRIEWSSIGYFLNLLPYDEKMKHIRELELNYNHIFVKYVLPKLNKAEFEKLVNEDIDVYVRAFEKWPTYVLHIWPLIKSGMSNKSFCEIVKYILKRQTGTESEEDDTSHWCELWTSAPDRLKQAAIEDVLCIVDSSYFERSSFTGYLGPCRSVTFLLAILTDASIEDRRMFWNAHWETLLLDIKIDDLRDLMKLCFDHDVNQIIKFKKDVISKYNEMVLLQLSELLGDGCMKELDEALTFWCLNKQSIKELSVKLLEECFKCTTGLIAKSTELNKFIDNAYKDNDLAINFKKKLFLMPNVRILANLKRSIHRGEFRHVVEFVDTLVTSDELKQQIKNHEIAPVFSAEINSNFKLLHSICSDLNDFENFINWLFKSGDEIAEFKKELHDLVVIVIYNIQYENMANFRRDNVYGLFYSNYFSRTPNVPHCYRPFLKWYFANPESVEEFEKPYDGPHDFFKTLLSALEEP